MDKLAQLERAIGVDFLDRTYLEAALAHSSFLNEQPGTFEESNERLEFLGDAILGATIAEELYRLHPTWAEGELTHGRAAVVKRDTLAAVGRRLQLGEYLYLGKGEELAGGRERSNNRAAVLEALIGALFLDQGYEATRDVVLSILADEVSSLDKPASTKTPKSRLQEAVQGRGLAPPAYRIAQVGDDDHDRTFTAEVTVDGEVVGTGTGPRKAKAEQEAATEALKVIDVVSG